MELESPLHSNSLAHLTRPIFGILKWQNNLWRGLSNILPQRPVCKANKKAGIRTTGLMTIGLKAENIV